MRVRGGTVTRLLPLQRLLEAHQPADERVVIAVGIFRPFAAKQSVEPELGVLSQRRERRDAEARVPQPGRPDRDQERPHALLPTCEIRETLLDELSTRQVRPVVSQDFLRCPNPDRWLSQPSAGARPDQSTGSE